jgi:hypothetical protein
MQLKKILYEEYEGFADKRIKHLDRGSMFIVDDRTPGDSGADKKLFLWFCSIFAEVISGSEVKIALRGGVPTGASVNSWIARNKKRLAVQPNGELSFTIKRGQEQKLIELGDAIITIVAGGNRYAVNAYKYVCPRTARSLKRLATTLGRAWALGDES